MKNIEQKEDGEGDKEKRTHQFLEIDKGDNDVCRRATHVATMTNLDQSPVDMLAN